DVTVDGRTRTDERVGGVPERDRERGASPGTAPATASTGATADESRWTVAVGPEPPRDATVGVAVVRQPLPTGVGSGGAESNGRGPGSEVRIVVRRW
ncbi:MAG: hypothetical protein ACQERM_07815, partial [Methanobacteriota archaeon]